MSPMIVCVDMRLFTFYCVQCNPSPILLVYCLKMMVMKMKMEMMALIFFFFFFFFFALLQKRETGFL